jgi:hypothetical protein
VSSPIHVVSFPIQNDKDVAAHLVYAPRRPREQTQRVPTLPVAPQIELQARSFSGDRAMLERQPALLGKRVLLICSVIGVAVAAGGWAITWMPDPRPPLSVSPGNDDRWLAPVATRPEQPNKQVDVAARATPEPKSTQEPANAPDRSEPASFSATTATMTDDRWLAPVATRPEQPNKQVDVAARAMPVPKSTQEPANASDRSEPASFSATTATMSQPPLAQVPVPAPVVVKREPMPQQTVPHFVTRHLDADELASMFRRADDLIKSGDFSSARLLLRRVAEAGDARAAFTLAGTFDPNVLRALDMQAGAPDIALARLWYERAAQLGSADASRRLQLLVTASAQ